MKKMKIITTLAGACCLTALAGGLLAQNRVQAAAEVTAPTAVTDVTNHFFMEPGAAVRKNLDSVGIRYTAYVSEAWYNLATANDATVAFYTDIDKDGNTDEGEAVTAKAGEAVSFTTTYEGRENLYKVTGALTYTNLETGAWTNDQRTLAYNMQLEGQVYAMITKADGSTERIDAVQSDNVRSMGEVADYALKDEESEGHLSADTGEFTTTEETKLAGYRTTKNATAYIDAQNGIMDVDATYAGANIVKVKMSDTNDTYSEGVFNFNNDVSKATKADDEYATVYTDKGIIETNFKVCTKVIKSAEDWENALDKQEKTFGYYYLANDINGYPTLSMDVRRAQSTDAFQGVFDGGGHTASFSLTSHNGLFVYLNGANVKNVRFDIRMATQNARNVGLAFTDFGGSTYADVYVNVENLGPNCTSFAGLVYRLHNFTSQFVRTVVETPTATELESYTQTNMGALFYAIEKINTSTGVTMNATQSLNFLSDIYAISTLPLAREAGYAGSVKWTIWAQNKMPEKEGTATGITTDDIDATNKITYWTTTTNSSGNKIWSFDDFDEMKEVSDAGTIDPSKYTISSFWNINAESGYLEWKGRN